MKTPFWLKNLENTKSIWEGTSNCQRMWQLGYYFPNRTSTRMALSAMGMVCTSNGVISRIHSIGFKSMWEFSHLRTKSDLQQWRNFQYPSNYLKDLLYSVSKCCLSISLDFPPRCLHHFLHETIYLWSLFYYSLFQHHKKGSEGINVTHILVMTEKSRWKLERIHHCQLELNNKIK